MTSHFGSRPSLSACDNKLVSYILHVNFTESLLNNSMRIHKFPLEDISHHIFKRCQVTVSSNTAIIMAVDIPEPL